MRDTSRCNHVYSLLGFILRTFLVCYFGSRSLDNNEGSSWVPWTPHWFHTACFFQSSKLSKMNRPGDRVNSVLAKHGYEQIKKVGEGSFGKAILCRNMQAQPGDNPSDTKLIVKMIDISRATAKEKSDAIREGQVLRGLKHPYIVRYRESFIEDGWICIVMDFCEGGDLRERIKGAKKQNRPFSEEQVTRWLTQGILALKYIHEKHILHRDLKSSNFFLSKNGNLKLGDFGISKVLECTQAMARTQIGTPYYLSPEICMERPYAWQSDIWAMGCIVYELATLKVSLRGVSSLISPY